MESSLLETPVVLLIFNRPDLTARVFAEIAKVRPKHLFVVADGPRASHPDDVKACKEARLATEAIDWDCHVSRNYSDVNLGCGHRPATGLTWVFEQVTEAIILEDDCLPDPTFFPFCADLLAHYRHDERVMQICGRNRLFSALDPPYSYAFSAYNTCWGWATWRRAWRHFDITVSAWNELRHSGWLEALLQHPVAVEHWRSAFEHAWVSRGQVDYWDHQWTFACWSQSGLSVVPHTNLVVNLGFGPHATHTKWTGDSRASQSLESILFPLRHPSCLVRDGAGDAQYLERSLLRDLAVAAQYEAASGAGTPSTRSAALRRLINRWLPRAGTGVARG